jgi:hypothetical protein
VLLKSPVLLEEELKAIVSGSGLATSQFSLHYRSGSPDALKAALAKLCSEVEDAVRNGCEIVVLSDRVAGKEVEICSTPVPITA